MHLKINFKTVTYLTNLECSITGESYSYDQLHGLSPAGRPLLARYALDAIKQQVDRDIFAQRHDGFWAYRELLPVQDWSRVPRLGELKTPLIALTALHGEQVIIKDEGRLPTGSFKARGLALAVARAAELGISKLAMPSNGNAGAALAAYATRRGLLSLAVCPADTPPINIAETRLQGARVELRDGYIDDCGKRVRELVEQAGWFDCSTLKEPYRLEGKKTMGLELAEQLAWQLPEVIVYPTGGGTGLIGMWKAFQELAALGWLETERLPRMVAVQAEGCAPIVKALHAGQDEAERWQDATTLAAGIRVPMAVGDRLMLQTLRASQGTGVSVSEAEIVSAWQTLAQREGLLMCPEGAATYAAYLRLLADGWLQADERVVLFNCATGLKYPLPQPS